jgi:hypothetical protein
VRVVESSAGRTADAIWERRAGWGGIAFVVFSVAWAIVVASADLAGFESSDEEIRASYAPDGGETGALWLGSLLLALAGVGMLWFLGSLRALLRRAEPSGRLAAVAFAGGVLLVGLMFVKNSLQLGIAAAVDWEDVVVEPGAFRLLDAMFLGLIMHEGVTGAVLAAATSIVVLRTGVLPRWLGWAGVGAAVLAFFSVLIYGLGLFALLAWVAVVSILVLRGTEPTLLRVEA